MKIVKRNSKILCTPRITLLNLGLLGLASISSHIIALSKRDQFVLGTVEANCGDLVLFSMSKRWNPVEGNPEIDFENPVEGNGEIGFESDYVICNARTKQWVWLPPLRYFSTIRPKLALVCEPFYSFHSDNGKCCLQDSYRYRAISVSHAGFGLEGPVDVFSCETGQWSKLGVSCPEGLKGCFDFGVPPVVYNQMLRYLHSFSIMGFDPFVSEKDSVVACRVIDLPMVGVELPKFCCLGTCSECVRLSTGQRIDRAKL